MTGAPTIAPVSCVITSYNNRATIGLAIASVLCQSMPVAEIIVADDASSDGSPEFLRRVAHAVPNLRLITRRRNLGVAANRDLALREAGHPFVTHLDGDDLFARRKIEREWEALAGSKHDVAYSAIACLDPARPWRSVLRKPSSTVSGARDAIAARLLARRGDIPRDMLLSKALFEEAGGFDHDLRLYEDWAFKLRLAIRAGAWRNSGTLGTLYVQRAASLSSADTAMHQSARTEVVRRSLGQLHLDPAQVQVALAQSLGPAASATFPELAGARAISPVPRDHCGTAVVLDRRLALIWAAPTISRTILDSWRCSRALARSLEKISRS